MTKQKHTKHQQCESHLTQVILLGIFVGDFHSRRNVRVVWGGRRDILFISFVIIPRMILVTNPTPK